jgi:hypothetical protein
MPLFLDGYNDTVFAVLIKEISSHYARINYLYIFSHRGLGLQIYVAVQSDSVFPLPTAQHSELKYIFQIGGGCHM